MKTERYNLFLALSLFLLVVVLFLGWGIFRKTRMDGGSQQLAIDSVQAVFSANNGQFLMENAHDSYLLEMSAESFDKYIASTQTILGPLDSINAIRGSTDVSIIPIGGESPIASYDMDLTFESSEALVQLAMIYQQGRWQFTDFVIQSDQLLD